jgi:integrase
MSSLPSLRDAAGRRRSPAPMPGFRTGVAPHNKGQRFPADPPTVDEIVAVMRQAGRDRQGHRLCALIVVLWRAGLRINEALSLSETDLDQRRGSVGPPRQERPPARGRDGRLGMVSDRPMAG